MSRENVELHRRFYDAFNAGDIEGMLALCHSEIEFYSRFVVVAGVTAFRGHVGMREWNRGFEEVWGDVRLAPEAYVDLGDRTLAFGTVQARGRQSGAEATMELFQALWWDECLCTVLKSYGDRDEALAQLGVAEDELDRIDP